MFCPALCGGVQTNTAHASSARQHVYASKVTSKFPGKLPKYFSLHCLVVSRDGDCLCLFRLNVFTLHFSLKLSIYFSLSQLCIYMVMYFILYLIINKVTISIFLCFIEFTVLFLSSFDDFLSLLNLC